MKISIKNSIKIELEGAEVARAILNYLKSEGILVEGALTVKVNNSLCKEGVVVVDPSAKVQYKKIESFEDILKRKIDYYGDTKAAYQFAAENYSNQF